MTLRMKALADLIMVRRSGMTCVALPEVKGSSSRHQVNVGWGFPPPEHSTWMTSPTATRTMSSGVSLKNGLTEGASERSKFREVKV